jgi:hypothetical protein
MFNLINTSNENTISVNQHYVAEQSVLTEDQCLADPNTSDGDARLEPFADFDQEAAYRVWQDSLSYLAQSIEGFDQEAAYSVWQDSLSYLVERIDRF